MIAQHFVQLPVFSPGEHGDLFLDRRICFARLETQMSGPTWQALLFQIQNCISTLYYGYNEYAIPVVARSICLALHPLDNLV